eukprot:TRINITY_DN25451_c0_g1_i1.p1 TRINITY_DN25451_c0_g1~~TRINITY_DN25451_c0_g1_i1.p1  ORF type:complete len:261 (+),score=34.65 TRINITY_DN25451_c0_g1_i1:44-784(+)
MPSVTVKVWVPAIAGAAASAVVCAVLSKWAWRRNRAKVVAEAVRERRSMFLQDLNGEAASDADVQAMLEAANWAPTHGQTQPWRFSVFCRSTGEMQDFFRLQLTSSETMLKQTGLSAEAEKDLKKFISKQPKKSKEIAKCSHVIAVSMKRQANPEKLMPEWEEMAAVACAVQNAHIVACQLGVAAYWSSGGTDGPLATQEVRKRLNLESGDKCLGILYVGKADVKVWEKSQGRATRGPIAEKAHWY